jgi:oligopeptide/dipeptide ABC transporter ATP-binding protein
MIRAEGLTLDFHVAAALGGARVLRALDDVSLEIAPGEIIGLVGESGSGKTTLGKAILGVYKPGAGRILYRGADLAALDTTGWRPFRRELQMVFQDPLSSFNPRFTIGSSLALPLRLHRICPDAEIPGKVETLLKRVGLSTEHARRYPHELSGGQLQRIAIARAISVNPNLIVADEAVSKLDVSVRAQVLNLLNRMNRETGAGLIFITHDLGVARFLCHRIAVMFFGRIVEVGPANEIFARPRHPYTLSLLDARKGGEGHVTTDADEAALQIADPAKACNYAARCSRRVAECLTRRPPLTPGADGRMAACFVPLPPPSGHQPSGDLTHAP